jgi:hypothetical protein
MFRIIANAQFHVRVPSWQRAEIDLAVLP